MISLILLPYRLGICQLEAQASFPLWINQSVEFLSITKTVNELSIVAIETAIPKDIKVEREWCALMVEGPLDFSLTGVLSSLVEPLAQAHISVFVISTYNTDYILIKESNIDKAIKLLGQFCLIKS